MKAVKTAASLESPTLAVLDRIKYTYSVGTLLYLLVICVASNREIIPKITQPGG
ncbi:hypothetical protein [Microcoleus sp. herbarium12]|uniref:hypothetical protein n=1 Tax=Microcoleus sp. herbarium12 TaxID=3055437 RepID=UPI002FCED222